MDIKITNIYKPQEVYHKINKDIPVKVNNSYERRDILALSQKAKDFNLAWQTISKNSDDTREFRINEIKTQIYNKEYDISSEHIAKKIMDSVSKIEV